MKLRALTISALTLFHGTGAWAGLTGFLPNLDSTTDDLTKALIQTVGMGLDHRPMDPATALGTNPGFELGIEAYAARFPNTLVPALEGAGLSTSVAAVGIVPAPRFNLRKGLGPNISFGISLIWYQEILIYGGDFKITLWQPEEGLTWAIRTSYTNADILYVESICWTPALLVSRHLDFADPYLGIGVQLAHGTVTVNTEVSPGVTEEISDDAKGSSFIAFIGTKFRPPGVGLQLTLEGGYSAIGMHSLGVKFGFTF